MTTERDSQTEILKLKLTIKIFELLDYFGIDSLYESGDLLIGACPIHDGDNQSAFNINVNPDSNYRGRWFCNTKGCHGKHGNPINLAECLLNKKFKRKHEYYEVIRFCEDFTSDIQYDSAKYKSLDKDPHSRLFKEKTKKSTEVKFTREQIRKHLQYPAQFYIDRGFTKEALDDFDVGLCTNPESQMYNRIVFPVYDENDKYFVGSTGRTVVGDDKKWINQKGFNKSNHLYGYGKAFEHIRAADAIILVEGQGDTIRLYESGIRNVVGMFGSALSDSQEFLIQRTGVSNIILIPDNDEAGEKCKVDVYSRFKNLFNVKIVNYPHKDVGEMAIYEVDEIIKPQIKGKY